MMMTLIEMETYYIIEMFGAYAHNRTTVPLHPFSRYIISVSSLLRCAYLTIAVCLF